MFFGSGDRPNTPLVWRDVETDAELPAWRYQKSQSPLVAIAPGSRFRAMLRDPVPASAKTSAPILKGQTPSCSSGSRSGLIVSQDDKDGDCDFW